MFKVCCCIFPRTELGFLPRRATTAAASRPEASPGRLARCIRMAELKKLPGSPGMFLRSRALRPTDHKTDPLKLPKSCQSSTKLNKTLNKTLKNERLSVLRHQDARRAALATDAAQTDICFFGQPHRGDGRGVEPARLDPRNLGRGKGLGALRPGERAPRVAGPGISRVAGERIVAKAHVGARNIRRGERVGGGHASAAMSDAVC